MERLDDALDDLGEGGKRSTDRILGSLGQLKTALQALGVGIFLRQLYRAGEASVRTKGNVDAMTAGLEAAGDTMERDRELTRFLREETERLGFNYIETGRQLSNYEVALKGSNLSEERRLDLFRQLLEVLRARNLGEQDATLVLRAIGQIASKGAVSMEELRQQIGERLPGALEAAAVKLGVTRKELEKLISTGNLPAAEGLPAIIEGLREQITDEDLANSLDQTNKRLADMVNVGIRLRQAFAEGFSEELTEAFQDIDEASGNIESTGRVAGEALGFLGGAAANVIREIAGLGAEAGNFVGAWTIQRHEIKANTEALEESDSVLAKLLLRLADFDEQLRPDTYRDAGRALDELGAAVGYLSTEAERSNALVLLTETISRLQEENKALPESVRNAAAILVKGYEEAGAVVPGVLRGIVARLEDLGGAGREAAAETVSAVDQVEAALSRWEARVAEAAKKVQADAEKAADEAGLLLATIGDLELATEAQLDAAAKAVEKARDAWELYGQEVPEDLALADKAIRRQLAAIDTLGPAAEEAGDRVRGLATQIGNLSTASRDQADAVREAAVAAVEAYDLAGEEIPEDVAAIVEAVGLVVGANAELVNSAREAQRELEGLIEQVGGLQGANRAQIEQIEEATRRALDAYELAGEQIPPTLRAIAAELGVVSSEAQKAADELIAVVDALTKAFEALDSKAGGEDAGAGLREERRKLQEELSAIASKPILSGEDQQREEEIRKRLREIGDELRDIAEVGGEAAAGVDEVNDAIAEFLKEAGPGLAELSAAQQEAVRVLLGRLQYLGTIGEATGDTVRSIFEQIGGVFEDAGVDVGGLRLALEASSGELFSFRDAWEAATEGATAGLRDQLQATQEATSAAEEQSKQRREEGREREREHSAELRRREELRRADAARQNQEREHLEALPPLIEEVTEALERMLEAQGKVERKFRDIGDAAEESL